MPWLTNINKFKGFTLPGENRQHSVLNGLKVVNPNTKRVIIHDAVRPNIKDQLINECIDNLYDCDGVMPVLPVTDTIYFSKTGSTINELFDRRFLFAGQSPEAFDFSKYKAVHEGITMEELACINGSSEIAFKHGLAIKMIQGDASNYKITTMEDLKRFKNEVEYRRL